MGARRLRSLGILLLLALIPLGGAAGVGLWLGFRHAGELVDEKFGGKRWDLASRIYSDEFLLYPQLDVEAAGLPRRLERLRYREVERAPRVGGEFRRSGGALEIALRPGARGRQSTQKVRLGVAHGRITAISDLESGADLGVVSLEPEELTGIWEGAWEQRRVVKVVEVAPILVRSILWTEDRRFFEHGGIDYPGIARALLVNLRAGSVRQGGSTLTQQLMKNFFLTSERTVSRKLEEMAMAVVAERRYSKMEILENYLNEIYLGQRGGRGVFGVAEAASFYFGKDVRDLDVAEAALIAGLIRAPNAYSPFRYPERALARRNTVLAQLHDEGEIDDAAYEEAKSRPLGVVEPPSDGDDAGFFVDYVKRELATRFPETLLTTEGLEVYTTLDPLLQEQANRALSDGLQQLERDYPRLAEGGEDRLEAALVALAPGTSEIRALVGGRNYQESQFDRATQARRQPGSAFKPLVYLAGVVSTDPASHITAATLVDDSPFTWVYAGKREWSPRNYGDRYLGEITVRTALEESSNAAAARVAQAVGLDAIVSLAAAMGLPEGLPANPALVLGAAEVTPLEMTSAYGVLASGGLRGEPFAVKRVSTRGKEQILGETPAFHRVVAPAAAYVVTHLLEGVLDAGTARGAREAGFMRPAAGKTGTTDDYRDAWFVGFTPDLVAGTWVGFDRRTPLGLTGASAALPIWTEFMRHATAALPPRPFAPPPGVTMVEVERDTGEPTRLVAQRGGAVAEPLLEAFLAGDEPIWKSPLDLPISHRVEARPDAPQGSPTEGFAEQPERGYGVHESSGSP